MLFFVGPRQVGKTTTSLALEHSFAEFNYLSWDIVQDRLLLMGDIEKLEQHLKLTRGGKKDALLVLDEIHKSPRWKDFLKGFFDAYHQQLKILVTGSARLDLLQHVGDSLMGRYFLHRIHPLSVGEIIDPTISSTPIRPPQRVDREIMDRLFIFGGFPEPYIEGDLQFAKQWQKLRFQQLFRSELREITHVRELQQIELLGEVLRHQIGQICNYTSLANHIQVSSPTIRKWIELLKAFFYCFTITPWSKNVPRSLLKNPKPYLWDWSQVKDEGARVENFVASHLLKAVHHWTDSGLGDYRLHFLRDKEQREVDFLISRDQKPWLLVEVKRGSNQGLSPSLRYFHKITGAPHALQVEFDAEYEEIDCFAERRPMIVPLASLFSQLL